MSYKKYIETVLQELTEKHKITVVDEIDFNYNPEPNEILVVIKQLSGSVTGDVKFMPIQFNIFSSANEVNETLDIFDSFVASYSNTHTMIGLDYYKQDYTTPVVMNNFQQIGDTQRAQIFITGTLMVTKNICDITKAYINGKEINYTNVTYTYSTSPNPKKTTKDNLQSFMMANANLQITVVAHTQIGPFNQLITLLKRGIKSPNDTYMLKFEYTDGTETEHICRILSFNENYDITNPAMRSVVFVVC